MKGLPPLIVLMFFTLLARAQWTYPAASRFGDSPVTQSSVGGSVELLKRVSGSVETGFSFMSMGATTGFNRYLAPSLSVRVNPKFSLQAGFRFSQGNILGFNPVNFSEFGFLPGQFRQQSISLSGTFQVNPSLLVYGGIMHETLNPVKDGIDNCLGTLHRNSAFVGMEYKISEDAKIGIQVRQSQGNTPLAPFGGHPSGLFGPSPIYPGW